MGALLVNSVLYKLVFPCIALAVLLAGGCAETLEETRTPNAGEEERELRVQTWLELGDVIVDSSPVRIERFRIPGGRLAFISVEDGESVLAMTSSIDLDFMVDDGEVRVAGPEISLPESGEWQVRLHIAPTVVSTGVSRSVIVYGTWDPDREYGEPSPLPWQPEHEKSASLQSFTWTTSVSATVDLDTFLLDTDASGLIVRMPLEEWIVNVLEPTLRERLGNVGQNDGHGDVPDHEELPEHEENVRSTLLEDDGIGLSRLLERVSASFITAQH